MMYYQYMEIYDYTTKGGKNLIEEYMNKLPASMQAEIIDARTLIIETGVEAFVYLNTRQIYKKLWEIKISQERIMYVIRDAETVFFLHICKKQKGRAEKKNIELAKKRAKEAGLI